MNQASKKTIWQKLIVFLLVGVISLGVIIYGFRMIMHLSARAYYEASEQSFKIPELNKGFVPQGLDYDSETGSFFLSGYMNNDTASPVFVVDSKTGLLTHKVYLSDEDGEPFIKTTGAIAVHGGFVYLASGRSLSVFSYEDIFNADYGKQVKRIGEYSLQKSDSDYLDVSFVAVKGESLVVGEYYREDDSPTLTSHKTAKTDGTYNQAIAVEIPFESGENAVFGLSKTPIKAYSLPDLVQGMCFHGEKIFLSTSYAMSNSHIYIYSENKVALCETKTLLGTNLPVHLFDETNIETDMEIPPMSEEIVVVENKMYVMCNSASMKYLFGKMTGAGYCYATDLEKYEKE